MVRTLQHRLHHRHLSRRCMVRSYHAPHQEPMHGGRIASHFTHILSLPSSGVPAVIGFGDANGQLVVFAAVAVLMAASVGVQSCLSPHAAGTATAGTATAAGVRVKPATVCEAFGKVREAERAALIVTLTLNPSPWLLVDAGASQLPPHHSPSNAFFN